MKKQGFSLVELLVSVMVISIIAVAFAPIVTKRIHGGIAIKAPSQNEQNSEEEQTEGDKFKLFLPTSEECGPIRTCNDGRCVKCSFTVPQGVQKVNAVVVASGSGGGGGVAGAASDNRFNSAPIYYGDNHTVTYDPSTMSDFQIFLGGGGGGGGGETVGYDASGSSYCISGGGGASGGISLGGALSVEPTYNYHDTIANLKSIRFVVGKGGARGQGNSSGQPEDGKDGENTYAYLKYCYPAGYYQTSWGWTGVDRNGCFETYYIAYGGKGGKGGNYGLNGTGGVGGKTYMTDLNSQFDRYCSGYYTEPCYFGIKYDAPFGGAVQCSCAFQGGNGSTGGIPSQGKGGGKGYSLGGILGIAGGDGGTCAMEGESKDGSNGIAGYTYKTASSNYDGAAGGGGARGAMLHYKNFPVVPGETCEMTIGVGGKGGDVGHDGEAGVFSEIKCNGLERWISTGAQLNVTPGEQVGKAQTSSAAAQQGCTISGNGTVPTHVFFSSAATGSTTINTVGGDMIKLSSSGPSGTCASALSDGSGAKGGRGSVATYTSAFACGGLDSECANTSVNGQTFTFQAPSLLDIQNGFYGYAGGGGGGGGWDKATNTAGKGGDGQDGYIFLYWD